MVRRRGNLCARAAYGAGILVRAGVCILALLVPAIEPAKAEGTVPGVCAIESTAPAAIETALDLVLSQGIGENLDKVSPRILALLPEFGHAPGAVVSVQGPGWRYVRAAGLADPDNGTPVNCTMPFQIGSNTKMMTAAVILQMQEEGLLSIDDPLSRFLPDIAARLPNGGAITLRHLAQHTSGLFSYTDNAPDGTPGVMEGGMTDPAALRRPLDPDEAVEFVIAHGQPRFFPGEAGRWDYSNTGYILLGMVIERLDGRALDKSFEARLFAPLGMDRTYLWNGTPRRDFGLARSFLQVPFDVETTAWNMSQGWAAGGVISTPDDMHRFITALVAGRLFKLPETLALMQDTVPTGSVTDLGYGIGVRELAPGLWGHGGQTMGFLSSVGAFSNGGISYVAWGSSSTNLFALGDMAIVDALQTSGVLQP